MSDHKNDSSHLAKNPKTNKKNITSLLIELLTSGIQ